MGEIGTGRRLAGSGEDGVVAANSYLFWFDSLEQKRDDIEAVLLGYLEELG
jgi:hypothetical protein